VAAVGRWKTTKSYGMLDICISIATGLPAFGALAVPEPGAVVFVNEESGEAALWRRLDALCRGRAIDPESVRGRLFVARMKAAALNESAQNEIAVAIEFMRRLRDETGAALLFVHHTGHTGEHMRGSSDLETAWETRLRWKREGQSPEITLASEHREAEAAAPFTYRIAWDGLTRSMRFEAVEDPFAEWTRTYLIANAEASANEVYRAAENRNDRPRKQVVLELVKTLREGGSEVGNHPGTTPSGQKAGCGSPGAPFRAPGTTPTDLLAEAVPDTGTRDVEEDEIERLAAIGRELQP
jgi:hypothetical protein